MKRFLMSLAAVSAVAVSVPAIAKAAP